MFCSKCGTQLGDQYKFCKTCGTPVNVQAPALAKEKALAAA